jgi:lipopolysaccharide/colanic/teichoic acid biosynthesis glycosyltransferase
MSNDAEKDGAQWAQQNDPRVTKFGNFMRKTRIDELPQLWNVLKGNMTFVGPRPERKVFIKELEKEIPFYNIRHSVKPGLTGWAQVKYPYGASVEDAHQKLQYDLYYIKHQTLAFDLIILFKTVKIVIFGRGR